MLNRYWYYIVLSLSLLVIFPTLGNAQQSASSTGNTTWDLRNIDQTGLFVFYDAPAGASTSGKPLDIGDFDGNGCGDLAITGQTSSFPRPAGWRNRAGHIRLVMNACPIGGRIALEDATETIFHVGTIYGARNEDMAGTETYVADFNGDGYDDLLFSAQNNDGANADRDNAGTVYLVLGSPELATLAEIDLQTPPANVLVFYGADAGDRFGMWVEGGDVDGDGFQDMVIGANEADGDANSRINAGEAWVLYGAADLVSTYGQVVDMRQPPTSATRIIGADYDDLLGSTVWADDLNADGFAEVLVSAALWRGSAGIGGLAFGGGDGPGNARYNSGETYIIFGSADLRGQTVDLAARVNANGQPVDQSISVVYGADENDLLGEEIATGDLDGDSLPDLVLGTLVGMGLNNQYPDAGEAWVIYNRAPLEGQMFDLASPDFSRTVVIYPDQGDSKGGDTLRVADIDRDGIGDLVYGAPNYDPVDADLRQRRNAGLMAVIFGVRGGFPSTDGHIFLPSEQPQGLRVSYVIGADDHDMMSYAMAVYDVDGDGFVDIAPNGMGGDGAYNNQIDAGEIYVISGAEFVSPTHEVVTTEGTIFATIPPAELPTPQLTIDISQPGSAEQGREYYLQACAGCHGTAGEGGVGLVLVNSAFMTSLNDEQLLRFLQVGRPSGAPDNVTGVTMPPYGGRTDWSDVQLWDIVAYLRQLAAP
ncbi:MAG: c-type cytochrome [Anaerolineae bacterium]